MPAGPYRGRTIRIEVLSLSYHRCWAMAKYYKLYRMGGVHNLNHRPKRRLGNDSAQAWSVSGERTLPPQTEERNVP